MTQPFDRVVDRLPTFRFTGPRKGMAHCPAHKDRTRSLSVREFDTGVLGLHCFGGCPVASITSALSLSMEDLFPPREAASSGRRGDPRPFSAREILAALTFELGVVWVLLSDIAAGRELSAATRRRAGVARERCQALIEELRGAR